MNKEQPNPQERLRPYLVNSLPPFSRQKQRELLLRYRAGDQAAGDLLVRSHLRFAARMAIEFAAFYKQVEVEDLFSAACEGLLIGLDRFSLAEEYSELSQITYLVNWIKQRLHVEGRCQHFIRQPHSRSIWISQFWKFKDDLEKDGATYTLEEVYERMQAELGETYQENRLDWLPYQYRPSSMDRQTLPGTAPENNFSTSDGADFEEVIADVNAVSPEDSLYQEQIKGFVERAVAELPEIERFIVERVYGLHGNKGVSRSAVSRECGLSRQRVDQIYSGVYYKKPKKMGGKKSDSILDRLRKKLSPELLVKD